MFKRKFYARSIPCLSTVNSSSGRDIWQREHKFRWVGSMNRRGQRSSNQRQAVDDWGFTWCHTVETTIWGWTWGLFTDPHTTNRIVELRFTIHERGKGLFNFPNWQHCESSWYLPIFAAIPYSSASRVHNLQFHSLTTSPGTHQVHYITTQHLSLQYLFAIYAVPSIGPKSK